MHQNAGMTNSRSFLGLNQTGQTQVHVLPQVGRRVLDVARVEQLTPHYRRITLTGPDLADGFPMREFAPTDHVKVFFPDPETGDLVLPTITPTGLKYPAHSPAPQFRDYTVRAWDPATCELTLDFVVHEHGVGGRWAQHAQPGMTLGVLGPRGHLLFPLDYPRYIAAGDYTALPAITRFIAEAPVDAKVTAIIEIAAAPEELSLPARRGVDVRWVHRDTTPAAEGHLSPLETAIRSLDLHAAERVFVFVAGEATALKPIRRFLRREVGLPAEQVEVDGYWKRGVTNLDHHQPDSDDD